ncbi:MAG: hypothetical protein ACTSWQ_10720 [Candidatus Thorarchaeota archaeon]
MENVTETPTETSTETSNEIELLIDDEGIMDDATPSTPDATLADSNEQPSEDETPTSEQPSKVDDLTYDIDEASDKNFVIKVNGELVETSLQELKVLAQKGMDYRNKTMKLAEHKDLLGSLEQYGIKSIDDLNQYMQEGNSHIQEMPKSQYSDEVENVSSEIMEQENVSQFQEAIQSLPPEFVAAIGKDAKLLGQTYNSFNDGSLAALAPEAKKMMALRPTLSFMDAIQLAGSRIYGEKNTRSKSIQEPKNSFMHENSDVMTDKEFQEISAKLSTLS